MRVYLDNCCFNRPFDNQSQARVRLETEAKLEVQQRIRDRQLELAWSYILDFENESNPFRERREAIVRWRPLAIIDISGSDSVLKVALNIQSRSIRPKDALHLACAMEADCSFFLTTDDILLKKTANMDTIRVLNPTQFVVEIAP